MEKMTAWNGLPKTMVLFEKCQPKKTPTGLLTRTWWAEEYIKNAELYLLAYLSGWKLSPLCLMALPNPLKSHMKNRNKNIAPIIFSIIKCNFCLLYREGRDMCEICCGHTILSGLQVQNGYHIWTDPNLLCLVRNGIEGCCCLHAGK